MDDYENERDERPRKQREEKKSRKQEKRRLPDMQLYRKTGKGLSKDAIVNADVAARLVRSGLFEAYKAE